MKEERNYFVYILTNFNNTTLYTGVTNNLARIIMEHREGKIEGFTKKYKLTKLVYYELFNYINDAIYREKQIKAGSRKKKEDLIKDINRDWQDLFENLVGSE